MSRIEPIPAGERPVVSIIIPSYNSESTIEATLKSVLAQDFDQAYEIIVADSSTDGTPELIRRRFPSVLLLHEQQRMRSGTARNLGLTRAQGEILAFTDSDCTVPPVWLSRLAAHHRRLPAYAAVGGPITNANPKSMVSRAEYLAEFSVHLPVGQDCYDVDHVPTGNIAYKRWVFDKHGGFPGDAVVKQVDLQFNRRLAANGERLLCDPTLSVAHSHPTSLHAFVRQQWEIGRGTVQAMRGLRQIEGSWLARYPYLGVCLLPGVIGLKFVRSSARYLRWSPGALAHGPLTFLLFGFGLLAWGGGFARELLRRRTGKEDGC